MKIRFKIDKQTALLAGKDRYGHVVVDVPVASLSEAARKILSAYDSRSSNDKGPEADIYLDGGARHSGEIHQAYCDALRPIAEITPENASAVIESLVGAGEAVAAKQKAKEAAEREDRRAKTQAVLDARTTKSDSRFANARREESGEIKVRDSNYRDCDAACASAQYESTYINWPHNFDEAVVESEAAKAWQAELDAINAERRLAAERTASRKLELAEQAKSVAAAEQRSWIEQFGSPRLRRMVAEGIESEAVYRDERLASDRPGWRWERKTPGDGADPRNPSEEAFALLDEARAVERDAKLVYWTIEREEDESDYCDADEDRSKFAWRGYAAVATFLGRKIVYGVPEEYVLS